jgi:hypothetical protein
MSLLFREVEIGATQIMRAVGNSERSQLKKEYHETDYYPHVCRSHYVCPDEYYPIYQLHSYFQHATVTHRIHLDPETVPGLGLFSTLIQFSV